MKKIHVLVGLALAGAFGAAQAVSVDVQGYMRVGTGLNTVGGTATCFTLGNLAGGDWVKYRLGNECDYVIEPSLNLTLAKNADGSEWGARFGLYSGRGWGDTGEKVKKDNAGNIVSDGQYSKTWQGNSDLGANFNEAWFMGRNVPELAKGTIWGGRRQYNRLQLDINDQFLENDDGDGFGIDDINAGPVRITAGFMLNPADSGKTSSKPKLIAKVSDIPTFAGGKLKVHLKREMQSKTDDRSTEPATKTAKEPGMTQVGIYHDINVAGGNLLTGLRIKDFDDKEVKADGDLQGHWLAAVQWQGGFGPVGFSTMSTYEQAKFRGRSKGSRFTIGARADVPLADKFRYNIELSTDMMKNGNGSGAANETNDKTRQLTKLTNAFVIVPNANTPVPRFRLYHTYAKWNKNEWTNSNGWSPISNKIWGGKTSGSTIGFQAEAWF